MSSFQERDPDPGGNNPKYFRVGPIGKVLLLGATVGAVVGGLVWLGEHSDISQKSTSVNTYDYEVANPHVHYINGPNSITTPEQKAITVAEIGSDKTVEKIGERILIISLAAGSAVAGAEWAIWQVTKPRYE